MPIPDNLKALAGSWKGKSTLHLSWEEPPKNLQTSESTLKLTLSKNAMYATVHYTWSYNDEAQEGTFLIASDDAKNETQAAWSDTWHMPYPIMLCQGTVNPFKVTGDYSGGDQTWHWRTEISKDGDTLKLEMISISPDGKEEWAVRGEYKKA